MPKRFTTQLWESIAPIFRAILAHPFIAGLTDGSLPEDRFRFFAIQDALYLRDFARSLAAAAASAPRDEWTLFFSELAQGILAGERALHDSFFRDWRLSPEQVYATPVAPTTLAYTSYILRVAYRGTFEEVAVALLPCGWIYAEVGRTLRRTGSPNPLYQRWIDTYGSEEAQEMMRKYIDMVDEVVEGLPESRLEVLRQHFLAGSRYEWMFWDMAWRLEAWPAGMGE